MRSHGYRRFAESHFRRVANSYVYDFNDLPPRTRTSRKRKQIPIWPFYYHNWAFNRRTLRIVRANPKITYSNLRLRLGLDGRTVSKATLYREITKHGIMNWLARKRPFLNEEVVAKRLAWAREHELSGRGMAIPE
jgi:hypothetical protein